MLRAVLAALALASGAAQAQHLGEKVGVPTFGPEHLPLVADREDPLVDVSELIPDLIVQLAYATPQNIAGRPLYPPNARCLLRKSIAERLIPVAREFASRGMRLVAWDCARPHSAQVALFQAHPHPGSVADPKRGSLHERGAAIDLALADQNGMLVPLPTPFDTFGPKAAATAPMADGPAKEHRDQLIAAMYRAGFRANPKEWWHFSRLWGFRWPEVREEQLWPASGDATPKN